MSYVPFPPRSAPAVSFAGGQYDNGGNWGAIDLEQVGWAALSGALGGGLGELTAGLSPLLNVLANTVGSGIIGGGITAAQNALHPCNQKSVARSALLEAAFGGAGALAGNAWNAYGAGAAWDNVTLAERLLASSNAISWPGILSSDCGYNSG